MEKYSIQRGDRYNVDEKGYGTGIPGKFRIVIPRQIREARIPHDISREWSTSIESISDDGFSVPLFVLFKAVYILEEWLMAL